MKTSTNIENVYIIPTDVKRKAPSFSGSSSVGFSASQLILAKSMTIMCPLMKLIRVNSRYRQRDVVKRSQSGEFIVVCHNSTPTIRYSYHQVSLYLAHPNIYLIRLINLLVNKH